MAARLRLRHLWFLVPFWALALRAGLPIRDNSFLWHVQAGIDQLATGEVMRTDPYSFTALGEPWRTQSWLIELAYGRLEGWFPDLVWVPWFVFLVGAATLSLVLVAVVSQSGPAIGGAAVLITLGWVAQPYMHPRPVLLSFVLLAVVGLLTAMRRPSLWVIPGLLWLWAAVHGSFVVGAAFLVLDAVRRRSGRQALAVGAGLVAASFTAHGFGVWEILYRFAANREALDFIVEWQPPNFASAWLAGFLVALAILMVGLVYGRLAPDALWIVLPATFFALVSTRGVLPGLLIMAPWLAKAAQALPDPREAPVRRLVVWLTVGALAGSALAVLGRPVRFLEDLFPSAQVRAALSDAPLFNTDGPGGALIYLERGARPVFIDDRVELYGPDFFTRYDLAVDGRDWRGLFDEFDLDQALVPADSRLLSGLVEAGWEECVADDFFVVMAVRCPVS